VEARSAQAEAAAQAGWQAYGIDSDSGNRIFESALSQGLVKMVLEVAVDSVESAIAAQEGGAARVELCADLGHGGTTPSAGMIKAVREHVSLAIYAMIRPRAGDFCYSDLEFEAMEHDVESAKELGVDGIVTGMLTGSGAVDVERTGTLVELARPLFVTFHRAFDACSDLRGSWEDLKGLGVDRVLTSGGKPDIREGALLIADLVHNSYGSIKIVVGGGITFENVEEVVAKTRVKEVHTWTAVSSDVPGDLLRPKTLDLPRTVVDSAKVRRMVNLLRELSDARTVD
jgi:copper homeostasis protein